MEKIESENPHLETLWDNGEKIRVTLIRNSWDGGKAIRIQKRGERGNLFPGPEIPISYLGDVIKNIIELSVLDATNTDSSS